MTRLIFLLALGAVQIGCTSHHNAYELIRLQRRNLQLVVLPEVGGRVVYLGLKGHGNILKADSSLWTESPSLKPQMDMVNNYKPYWGMMVWPSPMDAWWQRQDIYPNKKAKGDRWPPDPYLIYGEFSAKVDSYRIELTGPKSPITGVQFSHSIELLAGNRVRFSCRLTNIREDTLAWGIWTNMQLPGASRCYVPATAADTMWFKKTLQRMWIPFRIILWMAILAFCRMR